MGEFLGEPLIPFPRLLLLLLNTEETRCHVNFILKPHFLIQHQGVVPTLNEHCL